MKECASILSLFTSDVLLRIDKEGNILEILLNTQKGFDISGITSIYKLFSSEEKVRVKRAIAMGFNSKKKFMEINENLGIDQYVDVDVAQYKKDIYMFIRFFVSNRQKEVEYERYVESLLNLSEKDPLTQAYNRHGLFEKVRKLISFSDPEKKIGIIFVDLDNLKKINDTHGHKAGDKALLSITKILVSTVRQRDIVARIGGDEFAVVVEEMSGSQSTAYGLSERLVKEFRKQKTKDSVTASLGIHVFKIADLLANSKNPEEFEKAFSNEVAKADNATYEAKQAGKNQSKVTPEFLEYYKAKSIASK
ncbi:GGDEF domain-containing protein [Patescibacteria group bacterium]|nr:GGDEF domain-containing protein [Patescibacteria group bacterium]